MLIISGNMEDHSIDWGYHIDNDGMRRSYREYRNGRTVVPAKRNISGGYLKI